jgi:hypothetical protein
MVTAMKRTYSKFGWLIAAICFLALGCIGAALDNTPRLSEFANGTKVTDWLKGSDLYPALLQLPDFYPVSIESRCGDGNHPPKYRAVLMPDPHTHFYHCILDMDEASYLKFKTYYQNQGFTQSSHSYFNCKGTVLHKALFVKKR